MPDNPNDLFVFFEPGIPVPSKNIRAYKKNNICPDGWVRKTQSEFDEIMQSAEVLSWIQWSSIRQTRNELLAESDWRILPDSPMTQEQIMLWKNYRQALRDITTDFATPDQVVWPAKP